MKLGLVLFAGNVLAASAISVLLGLLLWLLAWLFS
jgi:hypothetical protein